MKNLIDSYIESHKQAWSDSTLRSERARLNGVAHLLDGNPETLWNDLAARQAKPYARVTLWTRVIDFYEFLLQQGHRQGVNRYREFRKVRARDFKNQYLPKLPDMTFEAAAAAVNTLQNQQVREKALKILGSGLRYIESDRYAEGQVRGKGGKLRRVYVPAIEGASFQLSYHTFLRHLAEVNLTPHMLRKLFLNKCVDEGMNEHELLAVAGWSSLQTASSYIKARESQIQEKVARIHQVLNITAKS